MGGDLSGTASNAQIVANAVGTAEIANSAVTDAKISGMSSSKLTGALPAISGAALTNLPASGPTFNQASTTVQVYVNSTCYGSSTPYKTYINMNTRGFWPTVRQNKGFYSCYANWSTTHAERNARQVYVGVKAIANTSSYPSVAYNQPRLCIDIGQHHTYFTVGWEYLT